MKRMLAVLLSAVLVMACVPCMGETVMDLSGSRYAVSEKTAVVTVSAQAVNTVKSGIFGGNTSYRGGGYGFYDDTTDTFNETLMQRLRDSGVTHVRLPGGIEGDYIHWYECVGPVEDRKAQVDCFSMDYPTYADRNGVEYVVTFGPDEWFELCERSGTALTVQLNAGTDTPEAAADFVRYCLDSGVAIESITVGNEGCMAEERVAGITVTKTAQEYIDFYNAVWELLSDETKQELKDRDIPFGMIGIPVSHPLNRDKDWDSDVLKALGDKSDFIDIHIAYSPYFTSGNTNEQIIKCLMASADRVKKHLDVELTSIERFAPDMKIALSEYGPLGASPYTSGMGGGMFLAAFFHVVLAEEKIISADYLPLTNHPDANNLLGYYNENGEDIAFDNVVSIIFRMYAEQIGREVLETAVADAKTFVAPAVGLMPGIRGVSEGDAAVYYDSDTREGTLFILNKSYAENTVFDVSLPCDHVRIDKVTEMFTANNTMYNSRTRPTLVKPTEYPEYAGTATEGHLVVTTKPVSLLKVDFTVLDEQ